MTGLSESGRRRNSGFASRSSADSVVSNSGRSSTTRGRYSSGLTWLSTQRRANISISSASAPSFSAPNWRASLFRDRKRVVSGKSVSVSVDLGGRRVLKKKKTTKHNENKKEEK